MDDSIASLIRNLILHELENPIILKRFLFKEFVRDKWHCISWNIDDWGKLLGSKTYPFHFDRKRSVNHNFDEPQWEYERIKANLTLNEFLKWTDGETIENNSVLSNVLSTDYWGYFDYYYFKDICNSDPPKSMLSWDIFGFPEVKPEESTLWVGSAGANTPCHLDAYGSNIVCQIYGKKRWTLFSKEDSTNLYPTRVPYEESSIYSKVNFPLPDIEIYPNVLNTNLHVVTLEAGDVLLVPKHWWHFVENLDLSISVNTWIPLASDKNDRLKEAIILYQTATFCQNLTDLVKVKRIFNPNMMHIMSMDSSELNEFVKKAILDYHQGDKNTAKATQHISSEVKAKKCKYNSVFDKLKERCHLEICEKYSFKEYIKLFNISLPKSSDKNFKSKNVDEIIINAFTDDQVINKIMEILLEKFRTSP